MKMLITILISLFCLNIYAPPSSVLMTKEQSYQFTILTNSQYRIYYPLIKAIVYVESRGNDSAFNESEGAKGAFQIREIRLAHYNRLTGKNYQHDEMFDYYKSTEVFLFFAEGKTFKKAAKSWNGSGPMTIKYWELVNNRLLLNI